MAQLNGFKKPINGNPSAQGGSNNGQPVANMGAGVDGENWDEEKLEEAMKRLKEMHIQLRNLRTTIPRLIAPLTTKQPSPESLFREFSKSTNTANQEVLQFRKLWGEEETQKVLERARKSRAENPNDIKPWRAIDHPNWLNRDE
ncbi:hypothetical protein BGZ60DRAFT_214569 [Tricladium varicosporioides]|nr:hypothetical protein BGZ60DRAFT_214569 [Hymenoscyphus varicosporioides]